MDTKELEKLTKKQLIEIIVKNDENQRKGDKDALQEQVKTYQEGYNDCFNELYMSITRHIVGLEEEEKLARNQFQANRIIVERGVLHKLLHGFANIKLCQLERKRMLRKN